MWRETEEIKQIKEANHDFNPLPPCGGRREHPPQKHARGADFNPLPPCGGRPPSLKPYSHILDFNPLPPCGGRRLHRLQQLLACQISIHSLRVEGDTVRRGQRVASRNFNPLPPCGGRRRTRREQIEHGTISIHSLRVEGDLRAIVLSKLHSEFQSTPSVWRETIAITVLSAILPDFNPLPPCGGRHSCICE